MLVDRKILHILAPLKVFNTKAGHLPNALHKWAFFMP